jgi:peptidyl-prolyl cis-trans isomerase C
MGFSLRFAKFACGSALIATLACSAQADASGTTDAGAASSPDDARRAQVVAQGQGFRVTLGMLEDHINKQPAALRARYGAADERKALLDSLVRLELLAGEAERRGLAQNPAVRQTVKDSSVQSLLRSEIDEKVTAESISQADIGAYYTAKAEDFHHPAERRASHIALASEGEAKALLPEAQKVDLHAFAELARKHSVDRETKLRGGDLAFFALLPKPDASLRKVAEPLRKAAFALRSVGETAEAPIAVDGQFSILRLTGERPERHVTLAEAEGSIRSRLWRERRQKAIATLLDALRTRDKPKVFVERADWVKFDDMERRPSGFAPDPVRPIAADAGQKPGTSSGH